MSSDGEIGYRIMRALRPPKGDGGVVSTVDFGLPYSVTLRNLLGPGWEDELRGRTVIDFGCGQGRGSIEMAQHGAGHVTGIDIRQDRLAMAEQLARDAGVQDRCDFVSRTETTADLAISIDAFEHFDDPGGILRLVHDMLRPGGRFVVSFGPTWYHPYGGHFFSIFPWSHLVFSECSQIRWRAEFKDDGATRFTEVQGGLNLMTIAWFERLVVESGLTIERLRLVPIRKFRWFHNRWTREFTTALVECLLLKPQLDT